MGLLQDSWTSLNKKKFTNENSSGAKPYIITPIPGSSDTPISGISTYNSFGTQIGYSATDNATKSFFNLTNVNNPPVTADFLLRGIGISGGGGFGDLLNPNAQLFNKVGQDIKRWTKFFVSPNGLLFIAKQNLLARLQGKLPKSIKPTRIYNPANTLAQVAGVAFASHLRGKGLLPAEGGGGGLLGMFGGEDASPDTYYNQTKSVYNTTRSNRLTLLWGAHMFTNDGGFIRNTPESEPNSKQFGIHLPTDKLDDILFKFSGGPGSLFGLSKTRYTRNDNTTTWIINFVNNPDQPGYKYALLSPIQILALSRDSSVNPTRIYDFRKKLLQKADNIPNSNSEMGKRLTSTNYTDWNRTKTYGMGDPGVSTPSSGLGGLDRTHPYVGVIGGMGNTIDQINAQQLYQNTSVNQHIVDKDMIPFYITVMSNGDSTNDTHIHFRAFLGAISDTYGATWAGSKLMGRAEDFFVYGGFTRTMGLNFKVHAQSRPELNVMYAKLNYLASTLAPDYGGTGFMRGNMIKLTIGDYIVDQPGFLTGFSFQLSDSSPWDIGRNDAGEKVDLALPHLIDVSGFNFTPIHTFLPQKVSDKWVGDPIKQNMKSPFISLGAQKEGYGYSLQPVGSKTTTIGINDAGVYKPNTYRMNEEDIQVQIPPVSTTPSIEDIGNGSAGTLFSGSSPSHNTI